MNTPATHTLIEDTPCAECGTSLLNLPLAGGCPKCGTAVLQTITGRPFPKVFSESLTQAMRQTENWDVMPRGIACAQCQYELSGLSRDSLCPECAMPILKTLEHLIQSGSVESLKAVSRGSVYLILSILIPIALVLAVSFVSIFAAIGGSRNSGLVVFATFGAVVLHGGLFVVGSFKAARIPIRSISLENPAANSAASYSNLLCGTATLSAVINVIVLSAFVFESLRGKTTLVALVLVSVAQALFMMAFTLHGIGIARSFKQSQLMGIFQCALFTSGWFLAAAFMIAGESEAGYMIILCLALLSFFPFLWIRNVASSCAGTLRTLPTLVQRL